MSLFVHPSSLSPSPPPRYTFDKKDRAALAAHNNISERLFEPHGNVVLREEMLNLARHHADYKDLPQHLQALEALPQILVPADVLASMIDRANRELTEVRGRGRGE